MAFEYNSMTNMDEVYAARRSLLASVGPDQCIVGVGGVYLTDIVADNPERPEVLNGFCLVRGKPTELCFMPTYNYKTAPRSDAKNVMLITNPSDLKYCKLVGESDEAYKQRLDQQGERLALENFQELLAALAGRQ